MFDPNLLLPVIILMMLMIFSLIIMVVNAGFIGPFVIGLVVGIVITKLWDKKKGGKKLF